MQTELDLLRKIHLTLSAISHQLEYQTRLALPPAPNYRYPLADYWEFDWVDIDAVVLGQDDDGPTVLLWNNYCWKRRAGAGKFGRAIWFSRPAGTDENGETRYLRLITFKDWEAPHPLGPAVAPNGAAVAVTNGIDSLPTLTENRTVTADTELQHAPERPVSPNAQIVDDTDGAHADSSVQTEADEQADIDEALARWLREAKKTTRARIFDERFCLAFPQWQHPRNVRLVRKQLAALTEVGGAIMAQALQRYEQVYRQHKHDGTAQAHDLALAAARQCLVEPDDNEAQR